MLTRTFSSLGFNGLARRFSRQIRHRPTDPYYRKDEYGEHEDGEEGGEGGGWFKRNQKRLKQAALVSGAAGAYYWWHLEEAPITGRRRFIQVGAKQEAWMAQASYHEMMQQYGHRLLPPNHPLVRQVQAVCERIVAALPNLPGKAPAYRIHVINDPEVANALVLPGGEIFVFSGLLPLCSTQAGLAAVLGHEIAHQVARHASEKVSLYQFVGVAWFLLQILLTGDPHLPFGDLLKNLLLFLPFSRTCEREADYLGLLFMARACYDPAAAMQVWQRMQEHQRGQTPPAFLSTHPSHQDRLKHLQEWLPEAYAAYHAAGCPPYK